MPFIEMSFFSSTVTSWSTRVLKKLFQRLSALTVQARTQTSDGGAETVYLKNSIALWVEDFWVLVSAVAESPSRFCTLWIIPEATVNADLLVLYA